PSMGDSLLFAADILLQGPHQFFDKGTLVLGCQGTHRFPDILWYINRDFVLFRFLVHDGILPSFPHHIRPA
ncbi:MAG TPA: hypothetical protein VH590_00380, partial [Ktedonobacterales bacterium]